MDSVYKQPRESNKEKAKIVNFIDGFINLLEEFEIEKMHPIKFVSLIAEMNTIIELVKANQRD